MNSSETEAIVGSFDAAAELYRAKIYSNSGLPDLLRLIDDHEKVILDVGCGAGDNGRLLTQAGKIVHGVTLSGAEAEIARGFMEKVTCGNIETMTLDYPEGFFDAVVASHVLEHLVDPTRVLSRLMRYLRPGGRVYVALPNIAYYKERYKLLMGSFRYTDTGIMDRSHLHFFTYETAIELVVGAGYHLVSARAVGSVPLGPVRRLFGTSTVLDRIGCALLPSLFGFHVLVVGERRC